MHDGMSTKAKDYEIRQGDALAVLRGLPSESVQCVVTSPPYYGLRDYGIGGQIGLEATPQEFVAKMVEVFLEVRRVMRHDATLWLNLGDSYGRAIEKGGSGPNGKNGDYSDSYSLAQSAKRGSSDNAVGRADRPGTRAGSLKPKDLMGMPWRVAFALQEAGFWLRQDIIWSKPNPMPESVTDRCTKAHEYIFLLTKSAKYFYDAEAIKEPSETNDVRRPYGSEGAWALDGRPVEMRGNGKPRGGVNSFRGQGHFREGENGPANRNGRDMKEIGAGETRNKRSVWTVTTQPYSEAHFATFPEKLIEPCILAGTSEKGACAACGSPWVRVVENSAEYAAFKASEKARKGRSGTRNADLETYGLTVGSSNKSVTAENVTTGWEKSCKCETDDIKPCVVLDPFTGSGTTALVSLKNRRRFVGIELNPEYIKIAEKRLREVKVKLF